jgi:hypothetical protein
MGSDTQLSSTPEDKLNQYLVMRPQTDKRISALWVLLPIANVVIGVVIAAVVTALIFVSFSTILANVRTLPPRESPDPAFASGLLPELMNPFSTLFQWLWVWGIIGAALYAYLIYSLVRRRNRHFMRQHGLIAYLLAWLKPEVSGRGTELEVPYALVEKTNKDAAAEEGERSAILLAILSFIPVVNVFSWFYTFYHLTSDFQAHERRENGIIEDLTGLLDKLGAPLTFRRINPMPERSVGLYIILTVITFGLFGIYWLYIAISDPNKHFKHHVEFEDELVSRLSTLPKHT